LLVADKAGRRIAEMPCRGLLLDIYEKLYGAYGPRRWWPVTPPGGVSPEYTGGPKNRQQRFEVAVGAVLTQNTSWKNAAKAIEGLNRSGELSVEGLCGLSERRLAGIIRSAGYYNQKAKRLKVLAAFFADSKGVTRDRLLELKGIGPETADSIMLYAFNKPYFVVDAYTRRLLGRVGVIDVKDSYENVREELEKSLPRRVDLYKEFHALIVEHGKLLCRKKPLCGGCIIRSLCSEGGGLSD
jgi:endonuclease-3 related protein